MTEKNYDEGLKLFGEIYGAEAAVGADAVVRRGNSFGVELVRWTMEFVFASVWLRPQLERKLRSSATIGMLIALRQSDEIKYHTKMGIKNGLSRTELEEIIYTAVPYAGVPAAQNAKKAMLEAFAELDAE